ncbi:MFS transporter [Alicyclobacillus dauci]|uniref:MFS transporter n=1 Tax=Alicyclobacillus dauci TaxID=1475485 RepID=A0ABY6Z6J2_9BACL|nr:MFS transporter [Alicyclobacillus dauci]WAH38394.1 MFS transporter [Alicyclobacillus dauci]
MKHFRFAFVFALWTMVLYGAIDAMRSATGPLLQAQTHITYAELGLLFAANSIGYLLGSLPSGFVIHQVGLKRTVLFGSVAMGAMLVVVPLAKVYVLLWIGFFLLGLAMGWLEIGVNAVVPAVAESSRAESSGFNLLHGFYGVGATIFPAVVIWIATRSGHWSTPYFAVGLLCIATVAATIRYQFPALTAPEPHNANEPKDHGAMSSPLMYVLLLAIMLYVVAEGGTAAWLPTYLVHADHMSVTRSSWYLTGFYLIFTFGRLSGPLWVHRLGSYGSITWSSIFSLILFAIALLDSNGPLLFVLSGFGFAVTFPTIVHIASQAFDKETGRVLGLLFTCAGIGGIFVSWIIGIVATATSIEVAFWLIPVSLMLVLIATSVAKGLEKTRHRMASATVPPANS